MYRLFGGTYSHAGGAASFSEPLVQNTNMHAVTSSKKAIFFVMALRNSDLT
jgi:hypothetical protein